MKDNEIIICENCYEENEITRTTCKNCGDKLYKENLDIYTKQKSCCNDCFKELENDEVTKYKGFCKNCYNKKYNIQKSQKTNIESNETCNSTKKNQKTRDSEVISKINPKLFSVVAILIFILIIAIVQVINYNKDVKQCYIAVKNHSNWNEFQSIIDKHPILKSSFEEKAYQELYKVMDIEIERIKNGNYGTEEKSFNWYDEANKSKINDKYKNKIKEKQQLIELYKMINTVNRKYIVNEQYREAYAELNDIYNAYGLCSTGKSIAKKEKDKIKDKATEQVIKVAQERISKNDYSSTKLILEDFKDLKNETITNLYNICEQKEKETEKQREEQKKAEEKERIEKEKKDYEIYCYFNMIAWKEKDTITEDIAYSKCASKFGITKEQAKESYNNVKNIGYSYESKYPEIFEKYANQY